MSDGGPITELRYLAARRTVDSPTILINANWFAVDIDPFDATFEEKKRNDHVDVVKHTLQITVPTATVVNIQSKFTGTATKVKDVNNGTALVANATVQFDLLLERGDTYNIQHKTSTQNVDIQIFASFNTNI